MKVPIKIRGNGFTLVELLIVFAIISILATLLAIVADHIKKKALAAQEVAAAKNLSAGLLLYATDHRNQLMPGVDRTARSRKRKDGQMLGGEELYRYPWRLAPYVGDTAKGTFVTDVNKQALPQPEPDAPENIYHVSLMPVLGYNGYILGGYMHSTGDGTQKNHFFHDEELVTRAINPDSMPLIAFASAFSKRFSSDEGWKGNHLIAPPGATAPGTPSWLNKEWSEDILSSQFGNVDLRHNEQAVVARLDGSIEMLGEEQIKDMRNWSPVALEEDNAKHTLNFR